MELLDSIIHGSMNIGFGIGLAIIIAAVLLIIVFAIRGEKSNSPLCYLPALILAVLLSFQFSLMFGTITAKKEIDNLSDTINSYIQLITIGDNASSSMDEIGSIIENIQNAGQQYGPYDYGMLKQFVTTGQLTAQTLVWQQGMAAWTAAGEVRELQALFAPVPPATPQMPPIPGGMPPMPPTL